MDANDYANAENKIDTKKTTVGEVAIGCDAAGCHRMLFCVHKRIPVQRQRQQKRKATYNTSNEARLPSTYVYSCVVRIVSLSIIIVLALAYSLFKNKIKKPIKIRLAV